jgi:hypothetical protein
MIMHYVSSTFADRLPNHGLLPPQSNGRDRADCALPSLGKRVSLDNYILRDCGRNWPFPLLRLWTPIAGVILAIVELSIAFSRGHDPWLSVLLATLGVALALLGPGAWSLDARRSGWKRIEIRRPEN